MTQLELASKIGIDDSSLRRIESGKTNPTLKTIYRILLGSRQKPVKNNHNH